MKKFSLIELLVVISIIGILASLLLPTLSKAREKSIQAVCASKFKQIYMAQMLYTDDNDGRITGIRHGDGSQEKSHRWPSSLFPYSNSIGLYFCPNETRSEFRPGDNGLKVNPDQSSRWKILISTRNDDDVAMGLNQRFPHTFSQGMKLGAITQASEVPMFIDSSFAYLDINGPAWRVIKERHMGKGSMIFSDGHSFAHSNETATRLKWDPN